MAEGFLVLPNGIPCHDTFYRVSARLDPQKLGACVGGWMAGVCEATGLRHIAVDGKAVRAAPGSTFSGRLHPVSARAAENRGRDRWHRAAIWVTLGHASASHPGNGRCRSGGPLCSHRQCLAVVRSSAPQRG